MQRIDYPISQDLAPLIHCVHYSASTRQGTRLPLYADGYPGIMFQCSEEDFLLQPVGKRLSDFFLYGHTLRPMHLEVAGPYEFVVVQLYPFAAKYLLGIDPRTLHDDCFDLLTLSHPDMQHFHAALTRATSVHEKMHWIQEAIRALAQARPQATDDAIQQAIALILAEEGQLRVQDLAERVYLSQRSFLRKFKAEVGLTPKQFARIIQFQQSLHQLNLGNFENLTAVGLDSGFTDQSHFIKTFKTYTGQTPSFYLKQQKS